MKIQLKDREVMLKGILHQQEDENFTLCGEWWAKGSGGYSVEGVSSEDTGIPECPYCQAHIEGVKHAQSFIDLREIVIEAIARAEKLFQDGKLDYPDGSMTGYYLWIGIYVGAANFEIQKRYEKHVSPDSD